MSIQLKIDEMLDFLSFQKHPRFPQLKRETEALADALAEALVEAIPELVRKGKASFEGSAFAGTCALFQPAHVGPVPEAMEHFDVEQEEWADLCDAMEKGTK